MRTSCVQDPERNPFYMVREWQVRLCEGDHCAAVLISFFRYVHDWKLEQRQQAIAANDIAERHGDGRDQYEGLYQYYTHEDLHQRLLGLYSERAIPQSIKRLVDLGIISKHKNPNPRYSFDKTTYYLFHPKVCNDWIMGNYANGDFVGDGSDAMPMDHCMSLENSLKNSELAIDAKNVTSNSNSALSNTSLLQDRESKIASSSGKIASSSGNFAATRNNNTNYLNNTKKAAAITTAPSSKRVTEHVITDQNLAAASFSQSLEISTADLAIGVELTISQLAVLQERLKTVALPKGYSLDRLLSEISHTLLNPKAFTESGQQFEKKLNTVLKRVRQGLWTAPQEIMAEAQKQEQQQEAEESQKRALLVSAVNHAQRMLDYSQHMTNSSVREMSLKDLEQARAALADFDCNRLKASSLEEMPLAMDGFQGETKHPTCQSL